MSQLFLVSCSHPLFSNIALLIYFLNKYCQPPQIYLNTPLQFFHPFLHLFLLNTYSQCDTLNCHWGSFFPWLQIPQKPVCNIHAFYFRFQLFSLYLSWMLLDKQHTHFDLRILKNIDMQVHNSVPFPVRHMPFSLTYILKIYFHSFQTFHTLFQNFVQFLNHSNTSFLLDMEDTLS